MKIGLLGDVILSDNAYVDSEIKKTLNSTDFNICNLEAPFVSEDIKAATKSGLHQKVSDTKILKDLNIKVVSLANNHIGDFGPKAITYTRKKLQEEGITFFGAGENISEASKPAIINIDGKSIAFWGYMLRYFSDSYFATEVKPGIPKLIEKLILSDIQKYSADIKIVYAHWNQEFEDYPEPICKDLGEKLNGEINILIGSHPHCIQGIYCSDNYAVFHSLGNFIMPNEAYHNTFLDRYPEKCYHSMIIILNILESGELKFDIHPITIDQQGRKIYSPDIERQKEILTKIDQISKPLFLEKKEYRKFYQKNKERKTRFTLGRSERMNYLKMVGYRILLYSSLYSERAIVYALKKIGLYDFFKEKFARIINKFHSIR